MKSPVLSGLRVGVTRPRTEGGDDPFVQLLRGAGATAIHTPLTEILPPRDPRPLLQAVAGIDRYSWIIFTSPRSILPFLTALRREGADRGGIIVAGIRVCAVGPATAESLAREGIQVDLIPDRFDAEGVVEALSGVPDVKAGRVLLPRAEEGREVIPMRLGEMGIVVDVVPAYRSAPIPEEVDRLTDLVRRGEIDVLTFTSGSGVRAFAAGWAAEEPPEVGIVVLGPSAADALAAVGFPVHQQADIHTLPGLLAALEDWAGE